MRCSTLHIETAKKGQKPTSVPKIRRRTRACATLRQQQRFAKRSSCRRATDVGRSRDDSSATACWALRTILPEHPKGSHEKGALDCRDCRRCATPSQVIRPPCRARQAAWRIDRPPPRVPSPGGSVRGEHANLTGLVLSCIEAKFCKKICIGKLSPRSTQCTPLHRPLISIFSSKIAKNFCDWINEPRKFLFRRLRLRTELEVRERMPGYINTKLWK